MSNPQLRRPPDEGVPTLGSGIPGGGAMNSMHSKPSPTILHMRTRVQIGRDSSHPGIQISSPFL